MGLDNMQEKFQAVIKDNLPEAVSKELQIYLSDYEDLKKIKTRLEVENQRLSVENQTLSRYKDRLDEIKAGYEALERAKRDFVVEQKEMEITMLREKYSDVRSLMQDVFKNKPLLLANSNFNKSQYDNMGMVKSNESTTVSHSYIDKED